MRNHPDVLILGGGVIGLTTAWFLAREGLHVRVIDKSDFGREASWAGAGILPAVRVEQARTPCDMLRAYSTRMFPSVSTELYETTRIDNGYWRCGGLEFPGSSASDEWGTDGNCWDKERLREMEPAVADELMTAQEWPELAQLRNPRHLKALMAACQDLGVRLDAGCPAFAWERHGESISAARTALGRITAGRYLLATGAWTDPLLHTLGWYPGVRPIRGQIALLQVPKLLFRRVLLCGARYLVPRPDGRILIGSTEENAGFDKHTTAEAIAGLLQFATRFVPALADAHLERCWAGLRPGSPDGLPILGTVPNIDNLYIATGHYRAGIGLSPGTALVMKELLLKQPLTVPLEPFSLRRLQTATSAHQL